LIPDVPPMKREDLEAKITALLLGELPAEEAALLRELIARDAGLARLHDRLKPALELLRETIATPEATPGAPQKLSPERREKLLAQFKTVAPKEFAPPARRKTAWLMALAAVAALMLLTSMMLPALSTAKMKAQKNIIISNLRVLDAAKQQWAFEQRKSATDVPTMRDVQPYLGRGAGGEVPGGKDETYTLGAVGQPPVARWKDRAGKETTIALPIEEGRAETLSEHAAVAAAAPASPPPVSLDNGIAPGLTVTKSGESSEKPASQVQQQAQPGGASDQIFLGDVTPAKPAAALESEIVAGGSRMREEAAIVGDQKNLPQALLGGDRNRSLASDKKMDASQSAASADVEKAKAEANSSEGQQWAYAPFSNNTIVLPAPAPAPAPGTQTGIASDLAAQLDKTAKIGTTNVYSLNSVGYMNIQAQPGYSIIVAPLITTRHNNGAIGLQGGTAPSAQSPAPQINFYYDPATPALQRSVAGTAGNPAHPSQENRFSGSGAPAGGAGGGGVGGLGANSQSIGGTIPQVVTTSPVKDSVPTIGDKPVAGALFESKESTNTANYQIDKDMGQLFVITDDASKANAATAAVRSLGEEQQQSQSAGGRQIGLSYAASNNNDTARFYGLLPRPPGSANDDKSTEPATIKPEVIAIKYGSASDVAAALRALGASGGAAVGRSTSGANFGGPSGRSSFQNNLNKFVQEAASAGSSQMLANTKIIADERVNSLLIFANDDDKKKIDDILKNLDVAPPQPAVPPLTPQPEVLTSTNIFSTFSLNVSDASFKLAAASLQNGVMPEAGSIRSEEFINAFDYRDPEPAAGAPIGFAWERAGYPFAHHRDLLRFSVKTAAQGRQDGRPLNLVLLLDKSGSMERADRVEIIQQALRTLALQLHEQDTLSVVVFARTARLWVDGVPGSKAGEVANGLSRLTPEGGTNLEEAMKLAYATALRHYLAKGDNRVVLLTDGAANLGEVNPETLQPKVEANSKQGIALDCFGVGWDGYNDNLMETLSRAGHGRYGFINTPQEAATEFAGKLAGALRVAASDVKVQVEFNPKRVTAYRQIGYAKHQLAKEQFRDNTVAAAQIGAAESGNALYTVEVNPAGEGPLCTVRVRFRPPGTTDYQEHAWEVPYTGTSAALDQASTAMRLAATASAFSEWLASSPYAGEVTPDQLLADLRGVPEVYGADALPKKLEWMIRQAKRITGK